MISDIERLLVVKSLPGALDLAPETVAPLASRLRERVLRKGEYLFRAGEPAVTFFLIIDGSVSVVCPDGKVEKAGPGEAVGFIQVFARGSGRFDATADERTLVLEGSARALRDAFGSNFVLARNAIDKLSNRILDKLQEDSQLMVEPRCETGLRCPARKLDLVEKLILICRSGPYRGYNMDGLMETARRSVERRLAPGEILFRRDEPARIGHFIAEGELDCIDARGNRFTVACGQSLGELEALAGRPHWFDAVARIPCTLLSIDVQALLDILEDRSDMVLDALADLANALLEIEGAAALARTQAGVG